MPRTLYPSEARKIRGMLDLGCSDLEISRALHVAKSTVTNLRNEDQTYQTNQTLEEKLCPGCGSPKTEWISVKVAYQHDFNLSKEEIAEFDFVCPECDELININDL